MIPEAMTAVLLAGHGGYDKLKIRHDVPVPTPNRGEVLIRAWTDAELASIPCTHSAPENALNRVGLQTPETILITGASGGVGSAAVQLAKRRGAMVTASLLALSLRSKRSSASRLPANSFLSLRQHDK